MYLGSDCYPRTLTYLKHCRVQTKQKCTQMQSYKNAPTFTGNRRHSHVCLLSLIKIKTCTYQVCKRQSADTNVLISRYRLSVHLYYKPQWLHNDDEGDDSNL